MTASFAQWRGSNPQYRDYADSEILTAVRGLNPAYVEYSDDEIKSAIAAVGMPSLTGGEPQKPASFMSNVGDLAVKSYDQAKSNFAALLATGKWDSLNAENKASLVGTIAKGSKQYGRPIELDEYTAVVGKEAKDVGEAWDKDEYGNAAVQAVDFLGTALFEAIKNPKGFAYANAEQAANLAATWGPGAALGKAGAIGGGAVAGPVGAAVGGGAGFLAGAGVGSYLVETGAQIRQFIAERGGDPSDPAQVAAVLQDPAVRADMLSRASKKGLSIASWDAAANLLGVKLLKGAKGAASTAKRGAVALGAQVGAAAGGEIQGQLLSTGQVNAEDVGQEVALEMGPGGMADIALSTYAARNNGESALGQEQAAPTGPAAEIVAPPAQPTPPAPQPAERSMADLVAEKLAVITGQPLDPYAGQVAAQDAERQAQIDAAIPNQGAGTWVNPALRAQTYPTRPGPMPVQPVADLAPVEAVTAAQPFPVSESPVMPQDVEAVAADAPVVQPSGKPYASKAAAALAIKSRKLTGYSPIPVTGGFALAKSENGLNQPISAVADAQAPAAQVAPEASQPGYTPVSQSFTPTHELPDGSLVMPNTDDAGQLIANEWLDADGMVVEDSNAAPIAPAKVSNALTVAPNAPAPQPATIQPQPVDNQKPTANKSPADMSDTELDTRRSYLRGSIKVSGKLPELTQEWAAVNAEIEARQGRPVEQSKPAEIPPKSRPIPADVAQRTEAPVNVQDAAKPDILKSKSEREREATEKPALVKSRTLYGDTVYVRQSDLDGTDTLIPEFTANGARKGKRVHRENLDPTGEKQAALNREDADNPLSDIVTAKDGATFANELVARRELNRRGIGDTHEIVKASELKDGVKGFVLRRKAAEITLPRGKERLRFQEVVGSDPKAPFRITGARYAIGKALVVAPGVDGYKTRASRLATALGGKYSNRENGYIMSPAAAEKLHRYVAGGWDASAITGELEPPANNQNEAAEVAKPPSEPVAVEDEAPAVTSIARMAESAEELESAIKESAEGIVHNGKILYPTLQVPGMGANFQMKADGSIYKVVDGGQGEIKTSKEEAADLLDSIDKDMVQVVLKSHWGGSGSARDTSSKTVKVLHTPHGNSFEARKPAVTPDVKLDTEESEQPKVEPAPEPAEAAQPATEDQPTPEAKEPAITAILDAANVTGKDRLDIMAKFRSGEYTADDIRKAYPGAEAKPAEKIEDFGEKLGGARKDREAAMRKELSDDDIARLPLSEIWPKSDIDDIEDAFSAAFATAARAEIPTKPRVKYKVARWVEKVKNFRGLMNDMVGFLDSGKQTPQQIMERMRAVSALVPFADKVALLEQIDRQHWDRIGKVQAYPNAYRYDDDGKQVKSPIVHVQIDGKTKTFNGVTSVDEVVDGVNSELGAEPQEKRVAFEIRGANGKYFINKKGDKEYRKLKTFDTVEAAREYKSKNYDGLVAAWEDVKNRDNVKKTDVRRSDNRPRTGADYRNGRDATEKMFMDAFGFRGVEFGNWVAQGKNAKERQGMLNQGYDALMDLADIVGIPPKALSLNGTLGLGFGSRGSGWASAHFEPGNLVINLTKTRGAGSLAHEWFHSLDNYFARSRNDGQATKFTGDQNDYRRNNYITYRPEPMYVHKTQTSTPISKARLEQMHKDNPKATYLNPENWKVDPNHPEGVRPEVEERFADLVKALDESPMAMRARRIDKSAADGYWSRIIERAARSFENYTISKMMQKGYSNDYLANVVTIQEFSRDPDRYPYLLPEEVAPVEKAFDDLFGTIQTKETDTGVAMYSRKADDQEVFDLDWERDLNAALDRYEDGEINRGEMIPLGFTPPVLRMLRLDRLPLRMSEDVIHKATEGKHHVTMDQLRQIIREIADPAAVFDSDSPTAPKGSLVVLTSMEDEQGSPIVVAIHRNQKAGTLDINRVASIYGRSLESDVARWFDKRLRYEDKEKSLQWRTWAKVKPLGHSNQLRGLKTRIRNRLDLVNFVGKAGFSRPGNGGLSPINAIESAPLADQSTAATLNNALVDYGLGEEWSDAYEAVTVPDAVRRVGEEIQAAFGRDVRFVAPTAERFNIFNGFRIKEAKDSLYVNAQGEIGFINIAGHELLHDLRRRRPDLYAWYKDQAKPYLRDLEGYHSRLNELVQPGEDLYNSDAATEELLADFMGDSLADPVFLQQLADSNPSKFKQLLNTVRMWLSKIALKMSGLKSKDHITDVRALQAYLKDVLNAFADGKDIASVTGVPLYSRKATPVSPSDVEATLFDELRFKAQDKFHYLNKVQKAVATERGIQELPEAEDAYLAELRYHGMAGAAIEDFQREHVDPLIEAISTAKIGLEDVDLYLRARHAEEANAQLERINPDREDNTALSGMSNEEAAEILGRLDTPAMRDIGARVDTITKARRDMLVESGLETQETVDAWEGAYEHYVPLKREGHDGRLPPKGKGFNTGGKEKRRAGSNKDVVHVLANVVAQYEATAIKAEKVKVGKAFLEFARNNQNPELYEVDKVEYKPTFDAEGLVTYREDKGFVMADNVLTVRVDGVDHRITFNDRNPVAMRIAHALNNLGATESGPIINALSKLTRWLAIVNTGANPEFVISNFARDIQTVGYNLSATEADGLKWKIIKDVGKAWRGIRSFQKQDGKHNEWAKSFDEFRKAGAQTGWLQAYSDIEGREQALIQKIREVGRDTTGLKVKAGMRAVIEFIENENTAVENGIRLSIFVHARRAGMTEAQAAKLAKESSVNFNRKGDMGQVLNALYLFYNASIQGSVRLLQAVVKSRKVQMMAGATVIFAAVLDMVNRSLGGDDDDGESKYDKIPDFVKERNLIIMLPSGGGDYIKIPLPWGYNVLHVMGQGVGEAMTQRDFQPGKSAMRVAAAAVSSFNPIGGSESLLQFLSPTITDPLVQWAENKDWAGKPLRPASNPFGVDTPNSQKYWGSVRAPSKWLTDTLNELTGGDEIRPGAIDISPEAVDLLVDTFTGGAGRFVADTFATPAKALSGEPVESYEVPVLRKVYGAPGRGTLVSDFYERMEAVQVTDKQLKHYKEDPVKMAEVRKQRAGEVRLLGDMKLAQSQLRKIRKQIKAAEKSGNEVGLKSAREREEVVMRRFNRAYNQKMLRFKKAS